MKKFLVALTLLLCGPAQAWYRGSASLTPGKAQVNIGGGDLAFANVINLFKVMNVTFNTLSDAGKIDNDGYPNGVFANNVGFAGNLAGNAGVAGTYILNIPATRTITLTLNAGISSCSVLSGSASISGCTGNSATFSSSSGARIQLNWTGLGNVTGFFPPTGTYSGTGTVALYLASNEAKYLAGQTFTDDYINLLRGLHPKTLRATGWVQTGSGNANNNQVRYTYRTPLTAFSFVAGRFPPTLWAGGSGSSGAITDGGNNQLTTLPATDTPLSGWVDNEQITGVLGTALTPLNITNIANNGSGACRVTVGSTSTLANGQDVILSVPGAITCYGHYTVNLVGDGINFDLVGSTFSGGPYTSGGLVAYQTLSITGKAGGSKLILNNSGLPISAASQCPNTGIAPPAFTYDATIDALLCNPGGINWAIPIEVQAELANRVGANLWSMIPTFADDDYATKYAQGACSTLNSSLNWYPEDGNEEWNIAQWAPASVAYQRGLAIGFPNNNNRPLNSWYGMRVAQLMGTIIPAAWASCDQSRLMTIMAVQGGSLATGNPQIAYRLEGADLSQAVTNTAKYCTSTGGIWSGSSCTGSANYSTAGNQPVDRTKILSYAPYSGGANLFLGPDVFGGAVPTSQNVSFYQALIAKMDAGLTSDAAALVADDNIRGRSNITTISSVSGTTFSTSTAHGLTSARVVAFQVAGGTGYSNLDTTKAYNVTSTSSAGCPGAVVCNFTVQGFINGIAGGSDINPGTPGTGTLTVGNIGNSNKNVTTVQLLNSTWFPYWENVAASYDARRIGNGLPVLANEQYEGADEPLGPSLAQCISLGLTSTQSSYTFTGNTTSGNATISSIPFQHFSAFIAGATVTGANITGTPTISTISPAGFQISLSSSAAVTGTGTGATLSMSGSGVMPCSQIQQGIFAWRNDPAGSATVQNYFNTFMANASGVRVRSPAWLVLPGPWATINVFPLTSNVQPTSAVTQIYNGFATFSTNWLLKRDLDPASNDNDPMWLEKAA